MGILIGFLQSLAAPGMMLLALLGVGAVVFGSARVIRRGFGGRGMTSFILTIGVALATVFGGGKSTGARGNRAPVHAPVRQDGVSEDVSRHPQAPFGITDISLSNDMFQVTSTWTNGLFPAGTKLDYLVKTNLNDKAWKWSGLEIIAAGVTNVTHAIPLTAVGTVQSGTDGLLFEIPPSRLFVRVVPRLPVSDLRDSDGDGAPDIYEFHNETNPWVKDYACVRRTTLDSVTNLQAILDRVPPYSIIELAAGEYELHDSVHLPTNPVMLTAASPGAVIRSAATPGVFMFDRGQTSLTLIENLRVWLDARSGFQAAFWCGGNLPWSGVGASGTFRKLGG